MKISQLTLLFVVVLATLISCNSNKNKYDKLPKVLAELSQKIDKDPENGALYYQRALYYYQQGFMDKGFEDVSQAVKLDSENAQYLVLLSDFYFGEKETDLVEETLQKAIQLDPANNEARMKLAELYYHLAMLKECNETLDAAIEVQPHNPKAHLIRAFCLKETGDTTQMLRILQLCIDQDPTEKKAFLELGYYYQQQNNPLAIQYYQNALAIDATDLEINYNLAKLYQDLEMTEQAKAQYNKLLQLKPDSYPALNGLGYLALVYEDKADEAVSYFTRAIALDSLFPVAVCNRGLAFETMGMYDEARQDFQYCRKIDPNYSAAIEGLNRIDNTSR